MTYRKTHNVEDFLQYVFLNEVSFYPYVANHLILCPCLGTQYTANSQDIQYQDHRSYNRQDAPPPFELGVPLCITR